MFIAGLEFNIVLWYMKLYNFIDLNEQVRLIVCY